MCFKRPALHFQVKHQHLNTVWGNNSYPLLQGMVTSAEKVEGQSEGSPHSAGSRAVLFSGSFSGAEPRGSAGSHPKAGSTSGCPDLAQTLSKLRAGFTPRPAPGSVSSVGWCAQQSGTTRAPQQLHTCSVTSWLASCQRWGHFL